MIAVLIVFWVFFLYISIMLSQDHPVGRFWFYNWNRNYILIVAHVTSILGVIIIPCVLYCIK